MTKQNNFPAFTQEQKDFICHKIGEWYLSMKPLLEGTHNLGHMKERLKTMICDTEPMTAEEVRRREAALFAEPRPQLEKALEDFLLPALKNIISIYEKIKEAKPNE